MYIIRKWVFSQLPWLYCCFALSFFFNYWDVSGNLHQKHPSPLANHIFPCAYAWVSACLEGCAAGQAEQSIADFARINGSYTRCTASLLILKGFKRVVDLRKRRFLLHNDGDKTKKSFCFET